LVTGTPAIGERRKDLVIVFQPIRSGGMGPAALASLFYTMSEPEKNPARKPL